MISMHAARIYTRSLQAVVMSPLPLSSTGCCQMKKSSSSSMKPSMPSSPPPPPSLLSTAAELTDCASSGAPVAALGTHSASSSLDTSSARSRVTLERVTLGSPAADGRCARLATLPPSRWPAEGETDRFLLLLALRCSLLADAAAASPSSSDVAASSCRGLLELRLRLRDDAFALFALLDVCLLPLFVLRSVSSSAWLLLLPPPLSLACLPLISLFPFPLCCAGCMSPRLMASSLSLRAAWKAAAPCMRCPVGEKNVFLPWMQRHEPSRRRRSDCVAARLTPDSDSFPSRPSLCSRPSSSWPSSASMETGAEGRRERVRKSAS